MTSVGLRNERIPLADLSGLGRDAAVHRLVRLGFAAVLVALAIAVVVGAIRQRPAPPTALPRSSSGVVVLDASGSIAPNTYAAIGRALGTVTDARRRYGLVVFSDAAYEALPPGESTEELDAMRRFSTPISKTHFVTPYRTPPEQGLVFPTNPWTSAFSGGTRMSAGLRLAQDIVAREGIRHPVVLLLSDLGYSLMDAPALASALADYRSAGIDLRLMPLSQNRSNRAFFERLLKNGGDIGAPPRLREVQAHRPQSSGPPSELFYAALAVLLLLAANELWCGRLTWAPEQRRLA